MRPPDASIWTLQWWLVGLRWLREHTPVTPPEEVKQKTFHKYHLHEKTPQLSKLRKMSQTHWRKENTIKSPKQPLFTNLSCY